MVQNRDLKLNVAINELNDSEKVPEEKSWIF